MKNLFVTLPASALLFFAAGGSAQAPNAYKLTIDDSSSPAPYALAKTTVKVRAVVEKESVRTGPYARFAQKYLGAMAPLTDKDTYTIKSASIDYTDPGHVAPSVCNIIPLGTQPGTRALSHVSNDSEFVKVSPDRTSAVDLSVEDMARETANSIFNLRKRRLDLISGEFGEQVYGEGLKAALDEMRRLEEEYLSLFMGKQSVTTTIHEFDVIPEAGTNSYIAFRFSPDLGVLPDTDLSANPVVLTMQPMNTVGAVSSKADKRLTGMYHVPDMAACRLVDGSREIAAATIPVFQFGAVVPGK